nr:glycosyltransferase [Allorhizobium pseudoryzae]
MKKRVFFYVQHLLGIGHIVRASRIAEAMQATGLDVTMVTGGKPVDGFPGPSLKHIALPPVIASTAGFSGLADIDGVSVDEAFLTQRRDRLLSAFRDCEPDVVVIEAFPFGRRQMRFELLPLLDAIKAAPRRPLLFSSVRDILQENRKAGRDAETVQLLEDHFDGVLVHGDPQFVRLEETFPLAERIAEKVHYTGLVAPEPPEPAKDRFDLIVSAGGGAVGAALIDAAIQAQALLQDPRSWCLITGPNLPQEDFDRLSRQTPAHVTLVRFRRDFPNLLMNASLSISQAGYNTVGDLLRAHCAAVLVPFASGGETEQTVRAEKLSALGFAEVVPEDGLNGDRLAAAIRNADRMTRRPSVAIAADGARQTAALIRDMLSSRG